MSFSMTSTFFGVKSPSRSMYSVLVNVYDRSQVLSGRSDVDDEILMSFNPHILECSLTSRLGCDCRGPSALELARAVVLKST